MPSVPVGYQCQRQTARRSSVCGPGRSVTGRRRSHVPVFVPRPPSPVSPHPGPDDDCPLSWLPRLGRLHRPARNHQSWDDGEERGKALSTSWRASHVGCIIAPLPPLHPPSSPPHLGRGPLEVCPSDAIVVIVRKVCALSSHPASRSWCIEMCHRDGPRTGFVLSIRWKRGSKVGRVDAEAPQLPSDLSVVTPLGRCVVTCIGRSPPPQVPAR